MRSFVTMEVLTKADLETRWRETMTVQEVSHNRRGFNKVRRDVNTWREQQLHYTQLPSGIQLKLSDQKVYKDYGKTVEHDENKPLTCHFLLSGDHPVVCPGIKKNQAEYLEKAGNHYLFFLPDIEEIEQSYQGKPNQVLIINVPLTVLREFGSEWDQIPQLLKPLLEKDRAPRFHHPVGKLTPMMQTVIKEMWNHPYQGAIAQMYLEGKALELISLQLFQLLQQENQQPCHFHLTPKEIEHIYEAQSILEKQYFDPPSVANLAQKIGLDRIKLQQGFQQIFQVTPFQYSQNYRLDLARVLLEDENLTVSAVAHRVGYANISYFYRTFKRRFGVTPGKYRS